jgi:hypothetical protein
VLLPLLSNHWLTLKAVQPVFRDTPGWHRTMRGIVKTSFANESYLERNYKSSLGSAPSGVQDRSFNTLVYSSQGSGCWSIYLTAWGNNTNSSQEKISQLQRPAPWTTDRSTQGQINSSWVQSIDMQGTSKKFAGRVVNNVTLAIPHPGILKAARLRENSIAQPNVRILMAFRRIR